MRSKKRIISAVIIILGVLLIIFGVAAPFFALNENDAASGIIGGADAPTYGFLFLRMWGGACFASLAIGVAMTVAGALVLWMDKAYGG